MSGSSNITTAKRAPKVAAPGAQRVTFIGIMAVPDDFGRLRILLLDRTADGRFDGSWATLVREVPRLGPAYGVPYEIKERPDADVRGTATVVVPARHRKHWGQVAESLRGKEVRVEATVRPYTFTTGGVFVSGAALDLAMLEPHTATPK